MDEIHINYHVIIIETCLKSHREEMYEESQFLSQMKIGASEMKNDDFPPILVSVYYYKASCIYKMKCMEL